MHFVAQRVDINTTVYPLHNFKLCSAPRNEFFWNYLCILRMLVRFYCNGKVAGHEKIKPDYEVGRDPRYDELKSEAIETYLRFLEQVSE